MAASAPPRRRALCSVEQGIVASGIVDAVAADRGRLTFGDDRSRSAPRCKLPSLAAADSNARRHSAGGARAAEKFALTDYLSTLAGPTPQGRRAGAFYERVAQMSGLPLDS